MGLADRRDQDKREHAEKMREGAAVRAEVANGRRGMILSRGHEQEDKTWQYRAVEVLEGTNKKMKIGNIVR